MYSTSNLQADGRRTSRERMRKIARLCPPSHLRYISLYTNEERSEHGGKRDLARMVHNEGESSLRFIVSVPSCHKILCHIFDSFSDYSCVLIYIRRKKRSLRPQYDIIRSNEVREWEFLVLD